VISTSGSKKGAKKHQALDVIEVQVREEDVQRARVTGERRAQFPDARPRVEDDLRPVLGHDLHA
jgi:hypothetical protein